VAHFLAFLAPDFFLGADFLAAGFLAAVFFGAVFFTGAFFGAAFFTGDFLIVFFTAGFLAADFLAAGLVGLAAARGLAAEARGIVRLRNWSTKSDPVSSNFSFIPDSKFKTPTA
jgi:hypothetical protein